LRRVHAERQGVVRHTRADETYGGLHRLCARFARELPVSGQGVRHGADRFRDDGAGGLDGVGVTLAADPHGADERRIDRGTLECVARGFE